MVVRRIVPNIGTADLPQARAFYRDLLGLEVVMDMGWVATLSAANDGPAQLTLLADAPGPRPDLTIEVDDLDAVHARAVQMGAAIPYPLTTEDWGVRRFFVADPGGHILNIMSHVGDTT